MRKAIVLSLTLGSLFANAQVSDTLNTREIEEVTVSASRKVQKVVEVPATINIISSKDIKEFTGFNLGELAARQKGVDFVRAGVLGTGINIRGFNSAFNSKNLQITDDRVSTLIATGLPFGTFSTVIKEDIEKVEILLGPNGTLYGPNAHNGLVNSISKNPFRSQGTTFALGLGNQNVFTGRLRHAQALSDKVAMKFAFEHSQGTEFDYTDSVYVNNIAYPELELDRDFKSQKFNGQLNFKPFSVGELIAYFGHSNNTNLGVTSAGRNQIKDWKINEYQLKYVHPRFFLNTYYQTSNTDDTYAMNQRTQNYVSFINAGFSDAVARERSYNEQWFGASPTAGIALQRGSRFRDDSQRYVAEGQYNKTWGGFTAIVGAQFQRDMAFTKNTYMLDFDGPINVNQFGAYGQAEYKLDGWGFLAALRVDNHDYYGTNLLPKAAITRKLGDGMMRLTYGKGMAVPSIMNLEGYLFGGLILGNGVGFTLSDGSKIKPLEVETIDSFEVGYKGALNNKFYIDANAYYNISENFISPLTQLARVAQGVTVTHRGDQPISEIPGANPAFVLTYSNFGKVDTYGFDLGLNYYFTDALRGVINYSYFGRNLDTEDMLNDGNKDGKVLDTDLPINTPENKISAGLNYTTPTWFGSVYGRWVQKYDFFSGVSTAAKTQDLDGDGDIDITENSYYAPSRVWNYGPLGGFTVDMNAGYNFSNGMTVGANVSNLFNVDIREFAGSPFIKRLVSLEFRYNIDFFKNK